MNSPNPGISWYEHCVWEAYQRKQELLAQDLAAVARHGGAPGHETRNPERVLIVLRRLRRLWSACLALLTGAHASGQVLARHS